MMKEEFCPPEEIQRMEVKLWKLRVKDSNIVAYTQRFNELVLLCPEAVSSERKKVKAYIRGLPEIIKWETTSLRPIILNEAVRMAHTLMEQNLVTKAERIAESNKQKWKNNNQGNNHNSNNNRGNYQNNNRHNQNNNQRQSNATALTMAQNARANQTKIAPKCNRYGRCHFDQCLPKCNNCGKIRHKAQECRSMNVDSGATVRPNVVCYGCGERGHKSYECPKRTDQKGGNAQSQAYVIRDFEHKQGPNVVTGTFLLNNRYATILFDSGANKSFVDIKFSYLIDIKPVKLNMSYEVKLADGEVVSTNSVLRGCTLNLLDHLFDIDLMPIELGTFDVIVGMDWLVECDALIVCGKKEVRVPYKNKMLVVKSDSSVSRLKKRLQDVPVICNFPEVFPDDLPGLPPPRQVEFKIELIPGAALVTRAPYRLAPSELKELSDQLKELSEKGFIRLSYSPWGAPEDHEEHLKTILELLKNEKLYAKFSKCNLWLKSIQFLDHVIDSKGVHVDPAKVQAIQNWSTPTTPAEKNKKYEWGMEEEEAFQTLKKKLCFATILALPEETKNFIVYCDASLKGFGAVLMQREKKELNMRQRCWIELLSDYDCEIHYHPCKGNIVADALSRKYREPLRVRSLVITVHTNLPERILEAQTEAMKEENVKAENLGRLLKPIFEIRSNGIRCFKARIWLPLFGGIRYMIMHKSHKFKYSIHLGSDKMYPDLMKLYLWPNIKADIATFVSKCLTCAKTDSIEKLAQLYLKEIVCRHGVHVSIISDRGVVGIDTCLWLNSPTITAIMRASRLHHSRHSMGENVDRQSVGVKSRQKSYADVRLKPMEFKVGDEVMLKVSPWKGVIRFGKRGKVSPWYVGPFKIIERNGPVAYKLELPDKLRRIHNTFHVSNLKKFLADENLVIPLNDKLHFIEEPVEIMVQEVKQLKQSRIPIVKVRSNSRHGPEYTWEREDFFKRNYPHMFSSNQKMSKRNRAPGRRSRKEGRM
nr:hypothetical protein [Tanacetum cinerariifolium]